MSIDTDYAVLRHVLAEHQITGWAAEFGVASGYSLGIIAEHMPVIGFDSFEGLPEDWREGFPKGEFNYHGDLFHLGAHIPNALIVKGLFEDTASTFPFPSLGLVHIDCDLYSSTVTALNAVRPAIGPGTIVVFDEFHGYNGWEDHEAKAWVEFLDRLGIRAEALARGEQERAFRVTGLGR